MSDHHNNHDQQDSENHDDCQDCKRQRAENDKLIAIYEKLQQVDKRTSDMKGSIVLHQQQVDKNRDVLKSFQQKVEIAKQQKMDKDVTQFQQIGYNLYAQALINARKSQAQKQNERLKLMLKKIYEDKGQTIKSAEIVKDCSSPSTQKSLPSITQKEGLNWFQKVQPSRTQSRATKSFKQTCMEKSFEIFSTKSTFNMTKRKTFDKKDFEDLNLWLFQQRNQAMEKQLYEIPIKPQSLTERGQSFAHQSIQRYKEKVKNANRFGVSTVLRSSLRKQGSSVRRQKIELINKSMIGSDMQQRAKEKQSFQKRYVNKRAVRGNVLPAIGSN